MNNVDHEEGTPAKKEDTHDYTNGDCGFVLLYQANKDLLVHDRMYRLVSVKTPVNFLLSLRKR